MAENLTFDVIARDQASRTTRRIGDGFSKLKVATVGAFAGMGAAVGRFAVNALGNAARAVVAFVADSVRQFAEFDRSMREVWTLLPDLSSSAFGDLQDDVRDFSKEMGVATTDTVPALYQAISAGVPQENVFDFLTTAAKFSIGGVTSLETAVDGLSSVVNAYGKEAITAEKVSDIFFTTVRLGKTNAEQLSASLFQVIPTAAALGIEFETVGAALATITAQGVPTSVATTQLRQLFVELNKEGGKTASLFDDLAGKSFADFIAEGGSVKDALALMKDEADDNNTSLSNLFGSVEAGNAALALTSEGGAKAFNGALKEMQDASGATDDAFSKMDEGMGRSWDRILIRFDDFKLAVGEKLAPAIESMLDLFEDLGDETTDQGKRFKELADTTQEQLDSRIIPALKRFQESMGETSAENQDLIVSGIEGFGALAGFWIDNIRRITRAFVVWKDTGARVWQVLIDSFTRGAEILLDAGIKAFGWVPGLGDQLRTGRERLRNFKDSANRILNNIRSNVDVNVNIHTIYSHSGTRPRVGGAVVVHDGGQVRGFGGMREVPAILESGEFVVRADRARENAELLRAINSGQISQRAGIAPAPTILQPAPGGAGRAATVVVHNHGVIGSKLELQNWLVGTLDDLRRQGRL